MKKYAVVGLLLFSLPVGGWVAQDNDDASQRYTVAERRQIMERIEAENEAQALEVEYAKRRAHEQFIEYLCAGGTIVLVIVSLMTGGWLVRQFRIKYNHRRSDCHGA